MYMYVLHQWRLYTLLYMYMYMYVLYQWRDRHFRTHTVILHKPLFMACTTAIIYAMKPAERAIRETLATYGAAICAGWECVVGWHCLMAAQPLFSRWSHDHNGVAVAAWRELWELEKLPIQPCIETYMYMYMYMYMYTHTHTHTCTVHVLYISWFVSSSFPL